MRLCPRLVAGFAAVVGMGAVAQAASAANETFDLNGSSSAGAYNAIVTLDIVGGQALSGGGTITGVGFSGEDVTLLTASTPGAEQDSGGLFGYRFNDGTDIYNEDTSIPIDTNGILFSIGGPPSPGQNAGFTVYNDGGSSYSSFFAGHVTPGSPELYGGGATTVTEVGSVSAAPEPSTWFLMIAGIGGIGLMLRRAKKTMGFRFMDAFSA